MAASIPKVIGLGLDTLYITARGRVVPELLEALERGKQLASDTRSVVELDSDEFGRFGGDPLYVRSYGGGGYTYFVFNEWGEFGLMAGDGYRRDGRIARKPTVRARLASEYLHLAPALAPAAAEAWTVTAANSTTAVQADK